MFLRFDEFFLRQTVEKHIQIFFLGDIIFNELSGFVNKALERVEVCIFPIRLPYFKKDGQAYFNVYHGDHYAMFLYFLSRECFENNREDLAEKLFLLNKYLHCVDIFYRVELPEIFLFVHPVGTVIGNAKFGRYTVFYQNVSIGAKAGEGHPTFGDHTMPPAETASETRTLKVPVGA